MHALELLPDPQTRAWAEQDGAALQAAGLPTQAEHGGATNTRHVTLLSAVRMSERVEAVLAACLRVRAAVGPPASRLRIGWTPHITLARRMPAEQVGRALEVLQPGGEQETTLELLRRWDPAVGRVRQLVPRQGA